MPRAAAPVAAALTDDLYHSLAELAGTTGQNLAMVEGFLQAQGNGLTWTYGSETQPPTATGGSKIATDATFGFGPAEPGWDLRRFWVRNTTAGSNATVVLNGRFA